MKKKKGYLIIQRGFGTNPLIPPFFHTPMKQVRYSKTRSGAKRELIRMKESGLVGKPISSEIKRSYGYGKNADLFLESFRFENLLTGKKWRDKK